MVMQAAQIWANDVDFLSQAETILSQALLQDTATVCANLSDVCLVKPAHPHPDYLRGHLLTRYPNAERKIL